MSNDRMENDVNWNARATRQDAQPMQARIDNRNEARARAAEEEELGLVPDPDDDQCREGERQ